MHCSSKGNNQDRPISYHGCDVDTTNGAMDKDTGIFKAKKRGIYSFYFQTHVLAGKFAYVTMKKGSTALTLAGANHRKMKKTGNTFSASVLVQLERGDEVKVHLHFAGYNIYSDSYKWTIFSGFLLASM